MDKKTEKRGNNCDCDNEKFHMKMQIEWVLKRDHCRLWALISGASRLDMAGREPLFVIQGFNCITLVTSLFQCANTCPKSVQKFGYVSRSANRIGFRGAML